MFAPDSINFPHADAVFVGRVVSRKDTVSVFGDAATGLRRPSRITSFQVARWWKGPVADTVRVQSGLGGGDCGIPFVVGKTYAVFANWFDGHLNTGLCSGTREFEPSRDSLFGRRRDVLPPPPH
jgi:hypothetical protein